MLFRSLEYGNRILVNMRQRIKEKKSRAVMSNCEKQITECLGVLGKAQTKLIGVGSKEQWQRFNDLYSQLNEQLELSLQRVASEDEEKKMRANLPRATLRVWDGRVATFQEWSAAMQRTLKWDAELDLPTMTSYIEQNDEYKRIMRRIGRARTIDQALKKLERFYGKFRMMETVLERDLEKLPNNPTSLKQETENCEQILNFIEEIGRAHV